MRQLLALALLLSGAAVACSKSAPPAPAGKAATSSFLEIDLKLYRDQVAKGDHAAAAVTGRSILSRHPGTAAADEVTRTLPEIEAKAKAAWIYQTGVESGGAQSAATIFSSGPSSETERVRLILRRHSAWGESAYLYSDGKAFSCAQPCRVELRFDDTPGEPWTASIPETGEPALFIDDRAQLVERLGQARRLEVDVTQDGGPRTIVFEVGGFDPARWAPLP